MASFKHLKVRIKELQSRLDIYEKPISIYDGVCPFVLNEQGALKMFGLRNKVANLEAENANLKAELEECKGKIQIISLSDLIIGIKKNEG